MTKQIIKLAIRTIPRMGLATILFLFLGIYLIFPTARLYIDMKQGNAVPCELVVSTDGAFDEAKLWELQGVQSVTPILRFNATLSTKEASCTLTVEAVRSGALKQDQISGSVFPEESNMPYLVLNTAAVKAFRDEAGKKTDSLDLDGSFVLSADRELPAKVCGILEDDNPEPMAYMSYSVARTILSPGGQNSGVTLRLTLDNAGSEPAVVSQLQEFGFMAEVDETRTVQWVAYQERLKSSALLCLGILISAAVLLRQRWKLEKVQYKESCQAVELCGMSKDDIRKVILLRTFFVGFLFSSTIFLVGIYLLR